MIDIVNIHSFIRLLNQFTGNHKTIKKKEKTCTKNTYTYRNKKINIWKRTEFDVLATPPHLLTLR